MIYIEEWRQLDIINKNYLQLNNVEKTKTSILKELIYLQKNRLRMIDINQYIDVIIELYRRNEIDISQIVDSINWETKYYYTGNYFNKDMSYKKFKKIRKYADKDLKKPKGIKREMEFLNKLGLVSKDLADFIIKYKNTHSNDECKLLGKMINNNYIINCPIVYKFVCSKLYS
jgi:hypothetical protein